MRFSVGRDGWGLRVASTAARVYGLSQVLGDGEMLFAMPPKSQAPDVIALDEFGPDVY